MGPPEQPPDRSSVHEKSQPPRTCRMQDVVTLPFPLTQFWDSGRARTSNTSNPNGAINTTSTTNANTPPSTKTATSNLLTTPCRKPTNWEQFEDGTKPIPNEIRALYDQVQSCKRHNSTNLLVRLELRRKMPEHFNAAVGTLKIASPLHAWFADTRLFTREEWLYLKGRSRGEELRVAMGVDGGLAGWEIARGVREGHPSSGGEYHNKKLTNVVRHGLI